MAVSIEDIKKLRAMTGAGLADVKKALTEAEGDFMQDYTIRITGVCADSKFTVEKTLYHTDGRFDIFVESSVCKPLTSV